MSRATNRLACWRPGAAAGQGTRPGRLGVRGNGVPGFPGRARLRGGLLRGFRRAQGHRPGVARRMAGRRGHRPATALSVRGTAHRDGPPVVQAPLDAGRTGARRTGELRVGREPGAGAAVLAVAATGGTVWRVPGRPPTCSGPCTRPAGRRPWVPPAWSATPTCSACGRPGCMRSTLATARRRLPSAACTGTSGIPLMAAFVVVFWSAPVDDGRARAVRGRRDRLHPGRHRLRGT